jgi:hypothetical protein
MKQNNFFKKTGLILLFLFSFMTNLSALTLTAGDIAIKVTDALELPVITSGEIGKGVPENSDLGTIVYKITASGDFDTYVIKNWSSGDISQLLVDQATGNVSLTVSPEIIYVLTVLCPQFSYSNQEVGIKLKGNDTNLVGSCYRTNPANKFKIMIEALIVILWLILVNKRFDMNMQK